MLTRWDSFDREVQNLLRGFVFNDVALPKRQFEAQKIAAPADVIETDTAFEVKVDLPGVDPQSINVQVEKDTLTITSERKAQARGEQDNLLRMERVHGIYSRSFTLPQNVDASKIEAKYEHGVLEVLLPKKEEPKPKTIQVKVG